MHHVLLQSLNDWLFSTYPLGLDVKTSDLVFYATRKEHLKLPWFEMNRRASAPASAVLLRLILQSAGSVSRNLSAIILFVAPADELHRGVVLVRTIE